MHNDDEEGTAQANAEKLEICGAPPSNKRKERKYPEMCPENVWLKFVPKKADRHPKGFGNGVHFEA